MLVMPHGGDQYDNGARIESLDKLQELLTGATDACRVN
jgi:hypothetical protein